MRNGKKWHKVWIRIGSECTWLVAPCTNIDANGLYFAAGCERRFNLTLFCFILFLQQNAKCTTYNARVKASDIPFIHSHHVLFNFVSICLFIFSKKHFNLICFNRCLHWLNGRRTQKLSTSTLLMDPRTLQSSMMSIYLFYFIFLRAVCVQVLREILCSRHEADFQGCWFFRFDPLIASNNS